MLKLQFYLYINDTLTQMNASFLPFSCSCFYFSSVWSHFEDFKSCEIKMQMSHLVQNIDTAFNKSSQIYGTFCEFVTRDVSRRVLSFRTNYTMEERLQNIVKSQVVQARKCTYSSTPFIPVATLLYAPCKVHISSLMSVRPQKVWVFSRFGHK